VHILQPLLKAVAITNT